MVATIWLCNVEYKCVFMIENMKVPPSVSQPDSLANGNDTEKRASWFDWNAAILTWPFHLSKTSKIVYKSALWSHLIIVLGISASAEPDVVVHSCSPTVRARCGSAHLQFHSQRQVWSCTPVVPALRVWIRRILSLRPACDLVSKIMPLITLSYKLLIY